MRNKEERKSNEYFFFEEKSNEYLIMSRREEGMATFTLHSPLLIIPTSLLVFLLLLLAYISPLTQNLLTLHRSSSTSPQLLSSGPAPAPNAPPPPLTFTTNKISTHLKVTPFFTFSLIPTPYIYIYDYGLFISVFFLGGWWAEEEQRDGEDWGRFGKSTIGDSWSDSRTKLYIWWEGDLRSQRMRLQKCLRFSPVKCLFVHGYILFSFFVFQINIFEIVQACMPFLFYLLLVFEFWWRWRWRWRWFNIFYIFVYPYYFKFLLTCTN